MTSSLCSRLLPFPSPHLHHHKSSEKILQTSPTQVRKILLALKGPAEKLLETLEIPSTTIEKDSEADLRKSRKTSPPYRVLLHNDDYNKREYVVQVLMRVIPGMTLDTAVNIMQEAHHNGLAVVIICAQVDAEEHCTRLRGNGLLSSIEPASGKC